jgi:hypothetical protein
MMIGVCKYVIDVVLEFGERNNGEHKENNR